MEKEREGKSSVANLINTNLIEDGRFQITKINGLEITLTSSGIIRDI